MSKKAEDVTRLTAQLAACGVAANGQEAALPDAWAWSPAYQSVVILRKERDALAARNVELTTALAKKEARPERRTAAEETLARTALTLARVLLQQQKGSADGR